MKKIDRTAPPAAFSGGHTTHHNIVSDEPSRWPLFVGLVFGIAVLSTLVGALL